MDDKLTAEEEKGKIVADQSFQHKTLEERIQESGCELTGIGEIDWGESQGSEAW